MSSASIMAAASELPPPMPLPAGIPFTSAARTPGIFRRFVTTRPGGNGLGLSTSREIAQAHGGRLSLVETDSGATFAVRLPAAR